MIRILALLIIALTSCEGVQPSVVEDYFSLQDVLDSQYKLLAETRSSLYKVATAGNDSAQVLIHPDSVDWRKELGIFERLDINKPKLKGQFRIAMEEDEFSNLTIKSYTALNNEAEVKYLKLFYLEEESNFRKLAAEWQESNPIYTSKRSLTLFFEDLSGKIILSGYEISGIQKMLLQDEKAFSLQAKIDHQ
ncbi:MAG: hypothetical protein AAF519_03090 [Bacteroidota bacterium]